MHNICYDYLYSVIFFLLVKCYLKMLNNIFYVKITNIYGFLNFVLLAKTSYKMRQSKIKTNIESIVVVIDCLTLLVYISQ